MITIFETGEFDYSDAGLKKPVKFTVKDLERVASKTSTINITKEHTKDVLGVLSNFVVDNGVLCADEPDGFDLKGMGFSPVFNTELIDMGEYYSIASISMDEVGLTTNPRNKILYNSISVKDDDKEVNMGESALEKVIREKDELQKRIGVYENSEKQYKRLIKQKEEEIESIKESYSDVEKLKEENKTLKEKADAYESIRESEKADLIQQIVGDDDELAKEYESFSVENLKTVLKSRKVSKPQKGVAPDDYPVDTGEDPVDENDNQEDEYTDEMFEADFAASGL